MNISAPFIRRPIATSLLAAALLLAGAWAYTLLAVAPIPRIDMPTIQVSVGMPGASPETMASSVATPLERRFGRIAGISEITSTSTLGSTSIVLQFDLDRNVDGAARDVQAAIAAAASELPPNLPFRPTYRKVNPADSPILILSLTSDTLPLKDVFEAANTVLAQKIAQVRGVGQVFVGGGQQPAVRVQVDPIALAGSGLSLTDVQNVIAAETVDQPKGSFTGNQLAETIAANDQLLKADAYKKLVLTNVKGQVVRLGDVADVFDDVENQRVAAWTDGTRAVLVVIFRQPDANIISTSERVRDLLPVLATSISPSIKTEVAFERTATIRASVKDVEFTLILSVLLVTAVVFVFLRDLRATAIPSIAVPLSIVGTFGAMYLLNYSVDNLSLMALTISTGFVVDDAIVVTENIARYVERGDPPIKAALEGAKQIGFTIVSITVSLLAVFIPILLMGGIVGRLFREFAVTLGIAVSLSALISLTLTPMMASRLLRPHEDQSLLARKTEAGFEWILRQYDRALGWVLRHQVSMLFVTAGTVALTIYLFMIVPKGLFPQQDTGRLMGQTEAPQDVSFPRMKDRQQAINAIVGKDPDILHYVSFVGGGGPRGGAGNTGSIFIDLKDKPARKVSSDEVIARLRPQLAKVEGIQLFLQSAQDIRVGGRSSRTQYQYTLQSADLAELNTWAPKVLEALQKLPELKDVATDQQTNGLQLNVNMDRDTAGRMGISASAIDQTLYDAYGQTFVAVFYTQINQYHVVLEVKPEFQKGPESINNLYVKSGAGTQVPLSAIVEAVDLVHRALGEPPEPVPVRHDLVQPRAGQIARAGDGFDQRRGAEDDAPGERPRQLLGDRPGVQGLALERAALDPVRLHHRLHRARHALRELHPPDHDPLDAPLGRRRRVPRAHPLQDRVQHHRPDRDHPPHRHREEERDHDDRLRDRLRTRRRDEPDRSGSARLRAAVPADHDDDDGRDPGRRAARARRRNRVGAADAARDHDRRRAPLLADADALHDAGHLPRDGPLHEDAAQGAEEAAAGRPARPRGGHPGGVTPHAPIRNARS